MDGIQSISPCPMRNWYRSVRRTLILKREESERGSTGTLSLSYLGSAEWGAKSQDIVKDLCQDSRLYWGSESNLPAPYRPDIHMDKLFAGIIPNAPSAQRQGRIA